MTESLLWPVLTFKMINCSLTLRGLTCSSLSSHLRREALSYIRNVWTRLGVSNPHFWWCNYLLSLDYLYESSLVFNENPWITYILNFIMTIFFRDSEWVPCDKDVTFVLAPNRISFLRKEQYLKTTFDSSLPFQNRAIARSLLNRFVNIWIAAPNYLRHAGAYSPERAVSI